MKMVWIAAVAAAASAAPASAESMTFKFELVPVNASGDGNNAEHLGDQLEMVVSTVACDPTKVDFTFTNGAGIASSISEIYFDDGATAESLMSAFIRRQEGSNFAYGSAAPGDLPGGNSLDDPFNASAGLLADARGNPTNGIDESGEFITIRTMLNDGFTYDDVIARLTDGLLRVGLHIRAIGEQDGSDSYVTARGPSAPPPATLIPLPSVASLSMIGLAGVASRRRRR